MMKEMTIYESIVDFANKQFHAKHGKLSKIDAKHSKRNKKNKNRG